MACDCISCKFSRGELTRDQYLWGMKNRLEVWDIVRSYLPEYGKAETMSAESLHMLEMNVSCAMEEICILLEEELNNEEPDNTIWHPIYGEINNGSN